MGQAFVRKLATAALAAALLLAGALPAAARGPEGWAQRPAPAAGLLEQLQGWLARLWAAGEGGNGSMIDPNGNRAEGDEGFLIDPNGSHAEGEHGPMIDPNG